MNTVLKVVASLLIFTACVGIGGLGGCFAGMYFRAEVMNQKDYSPLMWGLGAMVIGGTAGAAVAILAVIRVFRERRE